MQQFYSMLNTQSLLFLYIAVGFVLAKTRAVTPSSRKALSALTVNVLLPCSIFNSFDQEIAPAQLRAALLIAAVALVVILLSALLGRLLYRNRPHDRQSVLRFGTVVSNAAYAGMPVMELTYGPLGVFYAAIFVIPTRIYIWSAGRALFSSKDGFWQKLRAVALHPCILAVALGLARMALRPELPAVLGRAITGLGACASPLSMLFIGCVLGAIDLKTIFDRDIALLCFVRLLALPALIWALLLPFTLDPVAKAGAVTLVGMPVGANTAILADTYDCDAALASKAVFWSTLLSLVTVPLLTLLLNLS